MKSTNQFLRTPWIALVVKFSHSSHLDSLLLVSLRSLRSNQDKAQEALFPAHRHWTAVLEKKIKSVDNRHSSAQTETKLLRPTPFFVPMEQLTPLRVSEFLCSPLLNGVNCMHINLHNKRHSNNARNAELSDAQVYFSLTNNFAQYPKLLPYPWLKRKITSFKRHFWWAQQKMRQGFENNCTKTDFYKKEKRRKKLFQSF